ncbi:MAG: prepilin-type N-terminal cleavage/methylation domain-containing protein [Planctomycetota bacterium]|nr:prepilin-type N-terminal cleavage/methylation domain-containing protein [Planctomycetota bacterium]
MLKGRFTRNRGFSLLELVIVVVIIGIIAAIAIPRMSRGTAGAADSALTGDLAVLRNAIDLFAAEHDGKFPTAADIAKQLTMYTDGTNTNAPVAAKDKDHPFGPYIRAVPKLPVGTSKGKDTITGTGPAGADATAGWFYDEVTGKLVANCGPGDVDSQEKKYSDY